jgi:hypothetical protein
MKSYFSEEEYFIDHIWFHNGECRHDGNGILTWNPANGFHLAARVKRNKPLPPRKDFKTISLGPRVLLKMKLVGGLLAIVPNVSLNDLALIGGHISLDVNRVIFIQPKKEGADSSHCFGSALYETKTNLLLPDKVSQETQIGSWQPAQSLSFSGFHYEDNCNQKVIGKLTDKKYLDFNWSLPKSQWSKTNNWDFAKGLQDAISIVAGEVIQLRYHESHRYGRIYTEMRTGEQPYSLGVFFRLFDQDTLDRDIIVQLANFLTRDSKESEICRKIFYQMADASRQKTWQAKELLLSTILEAALRTLFNYPFSPEKPKKEDLFKIRQALKRFREQYLSDDKEVGRKWKKAINRVAEIHKRLRHRNAHPDWLLGQGGAYSTDEMERTINDVIFLSRFYKYMILALAGFKGMEPLFPKPFSDWGPIMTITRTVKKNEQVS